MRRVGTRISGRSVAWCRSGDIKRNGMYRNPQDTARRMLQGVLALADTAANHGGFRCVPSLYSDRSAWPRSRSSMRTATNIGSPMQQDAKSSTEPPSSCSSFNALGFGRGTDALTSEKGWKLSVTRPRKDLQQDRSTQARQTQCLHENQRLCRRRQCQAWHNLPAGGGSGIGSSQGIGARCPGLFD
jgi:hypothetical protein